MALSVTVLGCTGGYPGPGDACSGYLVQGAGVSVVFDLGPGTMASVQEHVDLADIDAFVISHCHPDHWVDLTVLNTAYTYALDRLHVPIFGTADTRERLDYVVGPLEPTWHWTDIADLDSISVGALDISFRQTDHYVYTLAARITDGTHAIAYSADTGPGWSFESFGAPIDLAVCEATMTTAEEINGVLHLSARQAGSMAKAAGVRRLVLTHFPPGSDPRPYREAGDEAFGAPVDMAVPHATFEC